VVRSVEDPASPAKKALTVKETSLLAMSVDTQDSARDSLPGWPGKSSPPGNGRSMDEEEGQPEKEENQIILGPPWW